MEPTWASCLQMVGSAQSSAAPRFWCCYSFDHIARAPRLDDARETRAEEWAQGQLKAEEEEAEKKRLKQQKAAATRAKRLAEKQSAEEEAARKETDLLAYTKRLKQQKAARSAEAKKKAQARKWAQQKATNKRRKNKRAREAPEESAVRQAYDSKLQGQKEVRRQHRAEQSPGTQCPSSFQGHLSISFFKSKSLFLTIVPPSLTCPHTLGLSQVFWMKIMLGPSVVQLFGERENG